MSPSAPCWHSSTRPRKQLAEALQSQWGFKSMELCKQPSSCEQGWGKSELWPLSLAPLASSSPWQGLR